MRWASPGTGENVAGTTVGTGLHNAPKYLRGDLRDGQAEAAGEGAGCGR